MKPQIIEDLPFADYCALELVNQSSFASLDPDRDGCPALYNHGLQPDDPEDDDTPAKSFGRMFHSFALTPELFSQEYTVETPELYQAILLQAQEEQLAAKRKPSAKFSKNLGAWKAYKEKLDREGRELISPKQASHIDGMWKGALELPPVAALWARSEATEVTLTADLDDGTGRKIGCKARLDMVSGPEICDLKTVASASPTALGRFIWKYRAYIQAAFYLDLAKSCSVPSIDRFSWVFIDKRPPHPAVYHVAEPALIKLGRVGYQQFLQVIADCRESGHWPGHADCVIYPQILDDMIDAV